MIILPPAFLFSSNLETISQRKKEHFHTNELQNNCSNIGIYFCVRRESVLSSKYRVIS